MNSYSAFIREFLKNPTQIGAIAPSSKDLAREIVAQAGVSSSKVIVEFGAGTGVFTREILNSSPTDSSFFTIEQNPSLVEILSKDLPQSDNFHIFNESAENLSSLRKQVGAGEADCIVSGLPWAAFPDDLQDRLLGAAYDNLKPGGRFVTFAYLQGLLLPAAGKFSRKINERFKTVSKSKVVWKNLPPAFVYKCIK